MNYFLFLNIECLIALLFFTYKIIILPLQNRTCELSKIMPKYMFVVVVMAAPRIIYYYLSDAELFGIENTIFIKIYCLIACIFVLISILTSFSKWIISNIFFYIPKKILCYHSIKIIPFSDETLERLKEHKVIFVEDCGGALLRSIYCDASFSKDRYKDVYDYIRENNIYLSCSSDVVYYMDLIFENENTVEKYNYQINFIIEHIKNKNKLGFTE